MKNKYYLALLFAIVSLSVFAQQPSNESMSQLMGADLSTGTASVGVPIYTLKDGDLNVPISLSYDASGMRPSTVATCVGTNWSLNAGGRIIRMAKDKPDEAFTGLDAEGSDLCMVSDHYWGYKYNTVYNVMSYPNFANYSGTSGYFYFVRDLQPDVFILSVAGLNVPFMLVPNNLGVLVPVLVNQNDDVKIEILEDEYISLQTPVVTPSFTNPLDQLIYEYPKKLRERKCTAAGENVRRVSDAFNFKQ